MVLKVAMRGMGGNWPNDRAETTYLEARAVIEAQNDTMADIDNKAMQTVRFNTILLGLLLAAANASSPAIFEPYSFGLSILGLTASVFIGLVTYNESGLFVGLRGKFVEELASDETENSWHQDLLDTFAGMISENSSDIDRNSWLLTATQGTLMIGIVAAIASVVF